MMKILSWNSRGLGYPSKISALRDLIHSEKPEILLIQETKQEQQAMRSIIDQQNQYKGCVSNARGPLGGIATLWDHNKWNCVSVNLQQHWIRTAFDSRTNNQIVIIYSVYAPNHYREKETC